MTKPRTPSSTRDVLDAALAQHRKKPQSGDTSGLLTLIAEMLLFTYEQMTAGFTHIAHQEQRIMSDLQDIKDAFTAQDAKLDAIGTAIDALEATIAGSSAAADVAVAAALADVKAAQGEAQTHVDAVTAKFPTPPAP